jgi:hypothetical protein
MADIIDGYISQADGVYNKVWDLGKDPKKASTPSVESSKKYKKISTKDATRTIVDEDEIPENTIQSNNITAPTENVTNASKNNPISPRTEPVQEFPGDGSLYNQFEDSYQYNIDKGGSSESVSDGKAPYSSFNRYSLFKYRGTPLDSAGDNTSFYNKIDASSLAEPTIQNIIKITDEKGSLGYRYGYSDFAMCKYLGKIANNYMVTLRRFPYPTEDDIITPITIGTDGEKIVKGSPDIARAVTWMSEETGNSLTELLSLTYGYDWKDVDAAVQEITSTNNENSGGMLGRALSGSKVGKAFLGAGQGLGGVEVAQIEAQGSGFDPLKGTYPNHVFGPYNKITSMVVRGDKGLTFEKEFTLKFQYEMKSVFGANPKILFMDQLSNMLALTYSNAPFWGGAVRYLSSGSIGKPFGEIGKLRNGDYKGFLTSVLGDLQKMGTSIIDDIKNNGLGGSKLVNNILGGSLMNLFNSPQGGEIANALLTGDATGQWHVTVGNPLNPMIVMGNLVCTNTKINFKGGNSVQDFPEIMEVEITLKPGRPRDKAEIESMFNAGRGRFYLQPNENTDINKTTEVSAYGNKDRPNDTRTNTFTPSSVDKIFRKFANQ